MPTIRAIIFDLDGVLVDCEPVHMRAWQEILAAHRIGLTERDYNERYLGLDDRAFLPKVFSDHHQPITAALSAQLVAEKIRRVNTMLAKNIPLIEGAAEFLAQAAKKCPLALVTNSLRLEVDRILVQTGFKKFFCFTVTANEVENGKPDPEGYLKAYQFLKNLKAWRPPLKKTDCLVFEDSQTGINAARAAGLPVQPVKKTLRVLTSLGARIKS